jgi:hypothetical protein
VARLGPPRQTMRPGFCLFGRRKKPAEAGLCWVYVVVRL